MKKLLLTLMLFALTLGNAYGYTMYEENNSYNKNGTIQYKPAVVNGQMVKFNSARFYPTGFLDGTVIDTPGINDIAMGAGRAYRVEAIDGNTDVNCFDASVADQIDASHLEARKCFLRHGGAMLKNDISGPQTAYPAVNNVFSVSFDPELKTNILK